MGKLVPKKRRGVAEVISSLLLVVITVVGAVILTSFLDESFVSGSLAVTSGTETSIKSIRLLAYDTRNGDDLMGSVDYNLDNIITAGPPDVPPSVLCRASCIGDPEKAPTDGGSDFMVIQIENRGINSIFFKNVILDGVGHVWYSDTVSVDLNTAAATSAGGAYPRDGTFSILSSDTTEIEQGDRGVEGGQTVNLLIKLDITNVDIELSKTMRVQVDIGASSLSDFLIETGDAR